MVIACPGSGKTRVLISKCVRILRHNPTSSVSLVTFTREAAREMNDRLRRELGTDDPRFRASTFHSFALRQLLHSDGTSIVLGPGEQRSLLERAWQSTGSSGRLQPFLKRFEQAASHGQLRFSRIEDEDVFDTYLELLAKHSARDLTSSITNVLDGMREQSVRPLSSTHLLVDEFQDVDPAQLKWIFHHADLGTKVTAVGDDDQSIYGFRSSMGMRAFSAFRRRLRPTVVHLSLNYRSRPELLQLGATLVALNQRREKKSLACGRSSGGVARLLAFYSQLEEAEAIAEHARRSPAECAVIARSNYKLDVIEAALEQMGVPYNRPGRRDFWEHPDCLLLTSLLDPDALSHGVAFANALSRAGVPESVLAELNPHTYGCPQAASLSKHYLVSSLRDIVRLARSSSPADAISSVVSWLTRNVFDGSPSASLLAAKSSLQARQGTMTDRLRSIRFSEKNARDKGDITLLTMHASKGLEFPRVWIPATQAGVIPHHRAECIEEERRLMYVAMTRAKEELTVSYAWNHEDPESGALRQMSPSMFLTVDLGFACSRPLPPRHH